MNIKFDKSFFIATSINHAGRETYLTKNKWSSNYEFKEFDNFNPKDDLFCFKEGCEIEDPEDEGYKDIYIVKVESLEEMRKHIRDCVSIPKNKISVLKIDINVSEKLEKIIEYSESDPIYINEIMNNFESYFVTKKIAKENNYTLDRMYQLRVENENRYKNQFLDEIYKAWFKLKDLD